MEQIILKIELSINNKARHIELVLISSEQIEEFRSKVNMGGLVRMGSVMFRADDIRYVEVIKE